MPPVLTEKQQKDYYASQSGSATPLSPLEFASQSGSPEPTTPEPTVGDIYKDFRAPSMADTRAEDSIYRSYERDATAPIDESAIRQNQMKLFQKEIDAVNQIYDQQYKQAQQEGLGRVGSSRAISARSGTLGSDFGAAQKENVLGYNRDIESSIQAERNAKIASIMGTARSAAAEEIAAKRAAKQQGAEAYLSYLSSKTERRNAGLTTLASSLLAQGVSPDEINPARLKEIADSYGVSVDDIYASYTTAEQEQIAAAEKAALEGQYTLSEGAARYDAEGNLIASRPKTYAPSSGGDSGSDLTKLLSVTEAQNLGVPYGTTVGQAISMGVTPRGKVTGSQETNLGFYNRGKDALEAIAPLEEQIANAGLKDQLQLEYAPNLLQSEEQQIYRQAQRQFTEARLRKESGAAIPDAEYQNDARTYFAQPGDTAETLARKKAAREQVLDSLAVSSGRAYDDYYGQQYQRIGSGGEDLRSRVDAAGYDYDAMKADGLSDEEIAAALE